MYVKLFTFKWGDLKEYGGYWEVIYLLVIKFYNKEIVMRHVLLMEKYQWCEWIYERENFLLNKTLLVCKLNLKVSEKDERNFNLWDHSFYPHPKLSEDC